ncbi:Mitochondrial intermembrane space cysteine motif-containing protein [Lachnellula arida]|uniref:Mitochondrial intermembrane space cysteine motif-containing protein n=2 Tax=Lachnellula TaxID=47830 RepID=A0A8T9BNC2_9HELO|nr:Mitochondrial intermembrane space cysteine motif-containing protein [Lachnellula arida]TVY94474.1 Mitochondrial intermembrane space cysteine motif-containing protein [Lachnellula willkommii]
MARQGRSGGGRAPSRPTVAPKRPAAPAPQQTRPATTAAHPPAQQAPPPAAQQGSAGPGLFGQMASTAAGVAVGSSIGHAIGGFFGGGSSQPAEQQADNGAVASQNGQAAQNNWGAKSCDVDAQQFTKCMNENQGDLQTCSWYLEQLKACQSAASQY